MDIENRERAKGYVERHIYEMQKKLDSDGYFVYDEYETIYIHTGRFIPEILNEKLALSKEEKVYAIEEMIDGEGCCGLICKKGFLENRPLVISILERFYISK